jgi:hypothetical protein
MSKEQTVSEMVERVLLRQARKLVDRTGMPLEDALQAVAATEAGAQLRELGEGEHRHEQARHWQANLRFERQRVGQAMVSGSKRPALSPSEPAPLQKAPPRGGPVKVYIS